MSGDLHARAAALSEAFDRAFAEPRDRKAPATEDFLSVRVAGEPCALRLAQVAALHRDPKLSPLPSPNPAVLGLVSLRGALYTVFDLRVLLGKPSALSPRWLVALSGAPAAFAFDGFEGLSRVETSSIAGQWLLGPPPRPILNLTMKGS